MNLWWKKRWIPALCIAASFLLLSTPAFAALAGGSKESEIDLKAIEEASCWILYFIEGSFGALLVAVAGLGALVSAATGMYRTAIQALVVALGAVMIEPIGVMFFNYSPQNCGQYVLPKGGTGAGPVAGGGS